MFGPGNSVKTYAQAALLKYAHMPDHFYKYRSFCSTHLDALERGVLYFTATDKLNDIKEANLVVTKEAEANIYQFQYDRLRRQLGIHEAKITNFDELVKAIDDHFKQRAIKNRDKDFTATPEYLMIKDLNDKFHKTQIEALRKESRSMYSVCCFSTANDINSMWAHYADNHNGFCIEYDFRSLGEDDLLTSLLFPVLYKDDNRVLVDDIDKIDGNIGLLAATLKETRDWGTESEWRLVHNVQEHGTPQPMPKPTAIYIGIRTDIQDIDRIWKYSSTNNIPIYQMIYNQNTNKIEPHMINS